LPTCLAARVGEDATAVTALRRGSLGRKMRRYESEVRLEAQGRPFSPRTRPPDDIKLSGERKRVRCSALIGPLLLLGVTVRRQP